MGSRNDHEAYLYDKKFSLAEQEKRDENEGLRNALVRRLYAISEAGFDACPSDTPCFECPYHMCGYIAISGVDHGCSFSVIREIVRLMK